VGTPDVCGTGRQRVEIRRDLLRQQMQQEASYELAMKRYYAFNLGR